MSHWQRAPFIVIEGLDRSGKTTQTCKLHETLKGTGVEAKLMKFPGEHCHFVQLTRTLHFISSVTFASLRVYL